MRPRKSPTLIKKQNNNLKPKVSSQKIKFSVESSRVGTSTQKNKKIIRPSQTPIKVIKNPSIIPQNLVTQFKNRKVSKILNPQQSISKVDKSKHNKVQQNLLNTRKSKLQSELFKKIATTKQTQLATPIKRSKNIHIHLVKGSLTKKQEALSRQNQIKNSQICLENDSYKFIVQQESQNPTPGHHTISKKRQNIQKVQSLISENTIQEKKQPHQLVQNKRNYNEFNGKDSSKEIENQRVDNSQSSNAISTSQTHSISIQRQGQQQSSQRGDQHQREPMPEIEPPSIPNPSNSIQANRNSDLSSLIANTQDIIEFINRLNMRNRAQGFDLMVGQLSQLNMIAQQVQQLGQIGNSFGYSLVSVFGTRIRELQTTIITQVGQALIASFQQRIDPQFQALVMRQPSLRQGFSNTDIENTFQEKLTFEEVECSICLQNVKPGERIIELQCFHEYHPICIKTWLQNSKKCPLCRKQQELIK